jgi:hypothetical protein
MHDKTTGQSKEQGCTSQNRRNNKTKVERRQQKYRMHAAVENGIQHVLLIIKKFIKTLKLLKTKKY